MPIFTRWMHSSDNAKPLCKILRQACKSYLVTHVMTGLEKVGIISFKKKLSVM